MLNYRLFWSLNRQRDLNTNVSQKEEHAPMLQEVSSDSDEDMRSPQRGFVNAADFGFSPEASGMDNAGALQRAVDQGASCAKLIS